MAATMHRLRGAGLTAILAGGLAATPALPSGADTQVPEISWRENYYNPQPAQGDLTLPMPCGGAMVFRRVDTPSTEGVIGDVPLILGQNGGSQPYLDGERRGYVSGAFRDPKDHTRSYFYMGKYEIAQAQYDAVMSPSCPEQKPRKRNFLPETGVSKLDFQTFAQRYTLWLMKNAPDSLPAIGQTRSYLRLPSEAEWEFAARGGKSVDAAAFRAPLPVLPKGAQISEYAAYGSSDSAGGQLQIIGTLKPNALGLHDMLGNAAEIVGTPFEIVRQGRLQGREGGIVKRGGDARTPLEGLSRATRYEMPPYDTISDKAMTDRYTGARLVLSGLAITSTDEDKALRNALAALAKPDPGPAQAVTNAQAIKLLDRLSQEVASADDRNRIGQIRAVLDAAQAEQNAQRDRAVRLIITSAVLSCDQAVLRDQNLIALKLLLLPDAQKMLADAKERGDQQSVQEIEAELKLYQKKFDEAEARAMASTTDFANFAESLAAEYSQKLLAQQITFLAPDFRKRSERRANCLSFLETTLDRRNTAGFVDIEKVVHDFQGYAVALTKKN